jgi:transcriptional regulator with XRE-family HTH domain
MSVFSERIKEIRTQKRLTQKQLGDKICVPQQTIARWEKEITTPDPEQLAATCDALNVSADYLLGLTDNPAPFPEISAEEMAELETRADREAVPMTEDELVSIMPPEMQDAIRTLIKVELFKAEERKRKK